MDPPAEVNPARERYALLIVALAPVIPQLLGSAFNIWYNAAVIEPMLTLPALKQRFFATIIIYNTLVFPIGIWLWVKRIRYFAPTFRHLCRGSIIDPKSLTQARRRLIHLPWFAAAICGGAWFLCIPVFLGSLMQVELSLDTRLLWHLPVSFCISGFISITHSIFLVELATHWGLFPLFFIDVPVARADEFGLLLGEFNNMIRGLKDKEKLRQTFGLHVGERAAEQILARDPGLSGVEEEITVMFDDIRSFTARAGVSRPAEMVEILNDFFRVTVRIVEEEHGGMVNKYSGDGFMAVFGAGDSQSYNAENAVAAGRDILLAVEELNRNLAAGGREPLRIGIGIHSGPAIVGSIGSPQRLEFTAIGDTVNIASRVEGLTKTVAKSMLITEAVRDRLRDRSGLEELPPQEVRGVRGSVLVFAPQHKSDQ